jgi:hypothetical protein
MFKIVPSPRSRFHDQACRYTELGSYFWNRAIPTIILPFTTFFLTTAYFEIGRGWKKKISKNTYKHRIASDISIAHPCSFLPLGITPPGQTSLLNLGVPHANSAYKQLQNLSSLIPIQQEGAAASCPE